MNSKLLTTLGLGNIDIGIVLIVMLILLITFIVLTIVTIVKNKKLQEKYDKFMQGPVAMSLETQIQTLAQNVNKLNDESEAHSQDIDKLFDKHQYSFQKMGLTKYDSFNQLGGKLSFALTLLDENNNGFLINSVRSAENCYSYTKRIKSGKSDLELSGEEQDSLNKALAIEHN